MRIVAVDADVVELEAEQIGHLRVQPQRRQRARFTRQLLARGPGSPLAKAKEGTFVDRMTEKGQRARGLYITYPYMHIFKAKGVARMLARTRLDTAVIDLKDEVANFRRELRMSH